MATGNYEKLEGLKAKRFIERLNRTWCGSPFDAAHTVVHCRDLPFARGWFLAEAGDAVSMPEKRAVVLDNGRECVPVEYGPDFVARFAAANHVNLGVSNAPDYVRFWLEYTRAGADRFQLVESLDDINWREEITPQARKSLSRQVTPLTMTAHGGTGFVFKACLLFRDTLFDATLQVDMDGKVAITERTVIAESLTVIDPLTGF